MAFNDVRASVVEVVSRWDELHHIDALPLIQRQTLAMVRAGAAARLAAALACCSCACSARGAERLPQCTHTVADCIHEYNAKT